MDAAPAQKLQGRGVPPRLLAHVASLDRLTRADVPSGRTRLEHQVGRRLAGLLVGALTRGASPANAARHSA
jgi:hypothetical protein